MTEEMINKIADWCVDVGYRNTLSGNYHIGFDEVAEQFNISKKEVIDNKEYIASCINTHEEILSETWIDEDFDMNFISEEEE